MTLYELQQEYIDLLEIMEDPDVDPVTLEDTFEAIGGEIEAKAEGYGKVIRQLEYNAGVLKDEIDRLTNRKKAIEGNIDRMKKTIQAAMELIDKPKIDTDLFTFRIQKNPASVVMDVNYIEDVPEEYLIAQDPKIDRKKIMADIKAGKDLDGIAHLEQGSSLRIK